MAPSAFDAIVIGAGLNGLIVAVLLARAGWKVCVLERNVRPGGAVQSDQATLPGFVHDLYATNLNPFAGSAFFQRFGEDLAREGFVLTRARKAFGSVFPDGEFLTPDGLTGPDAAAWKRLQDRFRTLAPAAFGAMRAPMPSWATLRGWRAAGLALQSCGSFVRRHFRDPKARAMWAAWGMHLDFPPHVRGGALYPFLSALGAHANGIALAQGGAATLTEALVRMLRAAGGELRCGHGVDEVLHESGRARGVRSDGERIEARRAVIANLSPAPFAKLTGLRLRRFRYGPGTMMIHLALADLPAWRDPRAREVLYVHLAPTLEGMSRCYAEASDGRAPAEPTLIVAQPTVVDPSRAPSGQHVLSIQVRMVPATLDREAYADHVLSIVERYAPRLRDRILGRAVLGPAELERDNPNLVGGDSIGGSHQLSQQYVLRPFLGWSRYRTPLDRLYLCGASTWPGAGTGAGSGWLLAQDLLAS